MAKTRKKSKYFNEGEHSESEDWVEIKEEATQLKEEHLSSQEDIKIVITHGRITKKNEYVERFKKALLALFRKIHNESNKKLHMLNLIIWVMYVDKLNEIIETPLYKALILSFLDSDILDLSQARPFDFEQFMLWFKKKLNQIISSLFQAIHPKLAMNGGDYLILAVFLRHFGFLTRLIVSLQPWNPKIDLVKSRKRFSYKKQDPPIEKSIKSKKDSQHSDFEDDDDILSNKKMPMGHREMFSIINECDPFVVDTVNNDSQSSILTKAISTYKKKLDPDFGHNYWLEVYVESTNKWICIGGWDMSINDQSHTAKCATNPLQYVVGVDQYNGWSDVTFKYSEEYLTGTKKLRIMQDWWQQFLESNRGSAESLEGLKIDRKLYKSLNNEAPLPSKLSDCKGHPHYVLERDLLRFEVFHPVHPPVVGYIKDVPVYSRQNVFTLQSKERWLIKNGREILEGSQCIKTTERRMSNKEGDIELFGKWQTKKVRPTLTPDGKIPINSFGNIELYKPWMLPQHCAHIPIQGVLRVAKRIGIQVAPAVVDWEYGCCARPRIEGVIILEEDKELFLEEWRKQKIKNEEAALLKKEKEREQAQKEKLKVKKAEEKAKATFSQHRE